MARTEFFDDPTAPKPNRLVVAASAVVTDTEGRILLQRRTGNGLYALPGGAWISADAMPILGAGPRSGPLILRVVTTVMGGW